MKNQEKRRIKKGTDKQFDVIHKTELFKKLVNRLVKKKKKEFVQQYPNIEDNTTAIKITDISDVSNSGGGKDETQEKLKNGGEIGMHHYTIYIEPNVKEDNFVRAIQNEDHEDNMCWVNTFTDHYKDTLMSEKNGRARE